MAKKITIVLENVDPVLLVYQRRLLIELETMTTEKKYKNALNGMINMLEKSTDEYLESIGK